MQTLSLDRRPIRNSTNLLPFTVVTAALLLCSSALAGALKVGDSFPAFSSVNLKGALPDMKGKVVLIDFWASWCGPCKKSFPVMKEIQDKFGSSRFLVVAISLDEQKSAMEAFLKKNPMPFAILRDEQGRLAEAIGVEKMPTSFILDAEGKVVAIHSGFDGEATRKQYLSQIEDAIKHVSKQN